MSFLIILIVTVLAFMQDNVAFIKSVQRNISNITYLLTWSCVQWIVLGKHKYAWWRHQMEKFTALLAICAGNSPVSGEFPAQRPVTRSFYVFFDLRPNKGLSKEPWVWWFETHSPPLWRHSNVYLDFLHFFLDTSIINVVELRIHGKDPLNTLRPRQYGLPLCRRHFELHFRGRKSLNFD